MVMEFHAQWFVFLKSSNADEGVLDPCNYILEKILELYFKSMGLFCRVLVLYDFLLVVL